MVRGWTPAPRTWLDVACGTGKHAAALHDLGLTVEGVDGSAEMVTRAQLAHPNLSFHLGTAQHFSLPRDRDVISMLFHAMSYQTSDILVQGAMSTIARHLAPGGLFVFDFWHTAGVRRDPPASRVRTAQIERRTLFRITHATENSDRTLVHVTFEFRWDSANGELIHEELHTMRHFRQDELRRFLADAGLDLLRANAWPTRRPLEDSDWYGVICARKPRPDVNDPQ